MCSKDIQNSSYSHTGMYPLSTAHNLIFTLHTLNINFNIIVVSSSHGLFQQLTACTHSKTYYWCRPSNWDGMLHNFHFHDCNRVQFRKWKCRYYLLIWKNLLCIASNHWKLNLLGRLSNYHGTFSILVGLRMKVSRFLLDNSKNIDYCTSMRMYYRKHSHNIGRNYHKPNN